MKDKRYNSEELVANALQLAVSNGWVKEPTGNEEWQAQAKCSGVPTARFFEQEMTVTRQYCTYCSVSGDCLEAGMVHKHGVWGGMSSRARTQLRVQASGGQ